MTNEHAERAGTVLVTGGSRGIGAAASRLAARRAAGPWPSTTRATRAAAEAVVARDRGAGGRALALQADVADDAEVRAMFATIDAALPPLGGLVNNAGVVDLPARVDAMTRRRACSACSRSTSSAASTARARRSGA